MGEGLFVAPAPHQDQDIPSGMRRPPLRPHGHRCPVAQLVFAGIWYLAITRQAWGAALGMMVGIGGLIVFTTIVFAWVAHNRSLARRREAARGGRTGAPDTPVVVTRDTRGHAVEIAPGAREQRVLVVRLEGDRKIIAPPADGDGA